MMRRFVAFLLLIFLLAPAGRAQDAEQLQKQAQEQKRTGRVFLNFNNADISLVVKFMSELTGKNIVLDPNVKGNITISSAKPVSLQQAWELFVISLTLQGYGVVEDRNFVRIVPIAQAVPLAEPRKPTTGADIVIYLFTAENTQAVQLQQAIQPFLSPFAKIGIHPQSNTIIIADIARNIEKIKGILRELDSPQKTLRVKLYPLQRAKAENVLQSVQGVITALQQQTGVPGIATISKDANAIIVVAREDVQAVVEEVIKTIDQSTQVIEDRSFYVLPLKFISAEELQRSLQSLLSGVSPAVAQPSPAPQPQPQEIRGLETPLRREQTQQPRQPQPIPAIQTKEGLRIGFDRGTNSVLIYATPQEFEGLKSLIERLDVRRRQVLIAASVVEMSTSRALELGVRWQAIGSKGGGGFGVGSVQDLYSSILAGNFVLGFINNVGRTITIGGSTLFFPDLVLLFSLLEKGSGFNLISNPKVLTLDNQTAEIKVGQVVPFASGVKFDINGQPVITYDYKEVGLDLKITPTIAENNLRLMIGLQVQEIVDFIRPQVGQLSYAVPVTSNRQVNSDVVVENGQTIIIGGLVSTRSINSQEGVPGLKDVPLFGRLFRRDSQTEDKVSLFIFLTPYVVESPEELSKITEEHQKIAEELRRLMESQRKNEKTRP
ncbi:MAG: type II secretion system secretin GspD [Aquificaceae bacterium]|jgi:general secretion pathway protein D|uniref:type II secretion system secretin GspD n=1 Tax=Hydrogenobacter sp. Uz 6-8 TaxID=3384828 RepID=UPI0030B44D39